VLNVLFVVIRHIFEILIKRLAIFPRAIICDKGGPAQLSNAVKRSTDIIHVVQNFAGHNEIEWALDREDIVQRKGTCRTLVFCPRNRWGTYIDSMLTLQIWLSYRDW